MITNAILLVFQGVLNVLLAPLSVFNIGVDFVSSIPIISSFIKIIAYVLPWSKLTPLISLIVGLFTFRITLALIRLVKGFIPTMGG